jgi:hypothetical protein
MPSCLSYPLTRAGQVRDPARAEEMSGPGPPVGVLGARLTGSTGAS